MIELTAARNQKKTFNLSSNETETLKILIAPIVAKAGLQPSPYDLERGERLSKEWCEAVLTGLYGFLPVTDRDPLEAADQELLDETVKILQKVQSREAHTVDELKQVVSQLRTLTAELNMYDCPELDLGGPHAITYATLREIAEFLHGKRSVVFKSI